MFLKPIVSGRWSDDDLIDLFNFETGDLLITPFEF
jgi:hypothetical protein